MSEIQHHKQFLPTLLSSPYSLEELTPELLFNEFSDCYVFRYTVSYENYGSSSLYLTDEKFEEWDEYYRNDTSVNSANSWGGIKIMINQIVERDNKENPDIPYLNEIISLVKSIYSDSKKCPKCNFDKLERTEYMLMGKKGIKCNCLWCGYQVSTIL